MFKYDRKTFLPSDQREKDLTYEDLKQLWEQEMNEMKDEENPEFIFQTMNMRLLLMVANKKINAVKAAKEELANLQLMVDDIYNDFVTIESKKRSLESSVIKNNIGASLYNSSKAISHFLIDDEISLDFLIKKIISENDWNDFKVLQDTNKKSLFIKNFFAQNFDYFTMNRKIINQNIICDRLRFNISSINSNYFSNC